VTQHQIPAPNPIIPKIIARRAQADIPTPSPENHIEFSNLLNAESIDLR